jgi:hypothetical protein
MAVFVLTLELLTAIPLIGGLLGIIVAAIGLGAVSLTRFGWQTFVPASETDTRILVNNYPAHTRPPAPGTCGRTDQEH